MNKSTRRALFVFTTTWSRTRIPQLNRMVSPRLNEQVSETKADIKRGLNNVHYVATENIMHHIYIPGRC